MMNSDGQYLTNFVVNYVVKHLNYYNVVERDDFTTSK